MIRSEIRQITYSDTLFMIISKIDRTLIVVIAFCSLSGIHRAAGSNGPLVVPPAVSDHFQVPAPGDVRLEGWLGKKIDFCIRNRIMTQDLEQLVEPFRHREETRWWQTEFWGKWFTSLALAYRYNQAPALAASMDSAAWALISTQSSDGYIGNYRPEAPLQHLDILCPK